MCVCVKSRNMGWRKEVHQPSWDLSSFSCCPFGWLVNRHVGQYVMLVEPPNSYISYFTSGKGISKCAICEGAS